MRKFTNAFIVMLATVALLSVSSAPIHAKGFSRSSSSRSFSRPSYSSSRSSSRSSKSSGWSFGSKKTSTKTTKATTKSGFKSTASKPKSSKFASPTVAAKQKKAAAKANHTKYVAKFKKPVSKAPISTADKKRYSNNKFISSSQGYNRSTRLDRRTSYYTSYHPSPYVYQSQSSFGMWDGMAMWYMLDNINDRNYYQMAYHQQNNAGFQEWRREANRLSADNAELKAKLANLDNQVNGMSGTVIDESYAPEGVDRDILLSERVISAVKPKLNICSGSSGGVYFTYANKMKNALADGFDVTVLPTRGTLDNLNDLETSKCDMALVQRDGYDLYSICANAVDPKVKGLCSKAGITTTKATQLNFTRISSPFHEAVVGVCKGVDSIDEAKTVAIMGGSGSVITWNNLVMDFPILSKSAIVNASSMSDAMTKVKTGSADCAFLTVSSKSKIVRTFDSLTDDDMHVQTFVNKNLVKIEDPTGRPVYKFKDIEAAKFGKAGKKHSEGWYTKTIRTITVPADVIVSNKYNGKLTQKIQARVAGIEL